ncbi:DNA topoisomerase III [Enterococcus faecium]|uniref:DNA topoisomerase III n=1 Tax=Enterococcus faecium TaxID=1352 RepID=UPI0019EAD7FF|nr:DNA topoisomerase III [Enterococcus faecium]EIB6812844.1 DNA topoisomerase III [Enterococcus faecium]
MKTVILAEKPSQAKAYADSFSKATRKDGYFEIQDRLFPGETVITYGFGHLVELDSADMYDENWKQWSLEHLPIFPNQYHYHVPKDKKKQFNVVKQQLQSADTIIIATDSDREGEMIAWTIIQQAGADQGKTFKRLWINSLEKEAIYQGFQQLRDAGETYPKFEEAQARQIADWLIGMNGSPLYSLLLQQKGIPESFSLGRVQTPTLYMIYQLQEKIRNFQKEPYFEGKSQITAQNGIFDAKFDPNETQATQEAFEAYLKEKGVQVGKQPGTILEVETEKKSAASPRLFSLSSLQSKMNQLMKASAKDTLEAMQGLYEGKYLSYPRTDTPYITEGEYAYLLDHLDEYKHFLKAESIPTPIHTPNSRYVNNKKVQEHYAIIPTKTVMTAAAFEQLSPLQQAIYEQVLKTTVAMFAEKYTYEETTILTQVQQLQLKAIGKVPVDLGWKKLFGKESDGKEKEEEPLLPKVTKGEMVTVDLQVLEKETKPPKPYTEGTLITAMKTAGKTVDSEEAQSILKEVEGIGTEATRANIIETLKQKEYIKVEKNKLVVTNKGILLCQAVEKEPLLTSAEMTAKWESYLLKIGERKGTQTTFLANIQKFVSHLLEVVPGQIQSTDFGSTLQEVLLYQKVAACTSEACDFKLWTTIAKKKLTATQLKEIIQNRRTSQPVKGLKGQKGSFEATIVLKEDFTTGFEFSEKKKTNFKKRTRRTTK